MELIRNRYLILDNRDEDKYFNILIGYDKLDKTPVTIRILKDDYSISARFLANLRKVLTVTKSLTHKNLPTILDFGIHIDKFFIVEKYEEGYYLDKKLILKEFTNPTAIISIISQIADCLKYLEQKNIIYSNLTIDSVFVTSSGDIKLTNLGLEAVTGDKTSSDDIISFGEMLEEIYSLIKRNLSYLLRENFEHIISQCNHRIYKSFSEIEKDVKLLLVDERSIKEKKVQVIEAKQLHRTTTLRKMHVPLIITTLLLLLTLSIWISFKLSSRIFTSKEIRTPDVVRMPLPEATRLLKRYNLKINVMSREPHPDIPPGHIIWQKPLANMKIKEGRIIHVGVSSGKAIVSVPNLRGLTIDDAKRILTDLNLKLGDIIYEETNDVEEGYIISQDPAPQEEVEVDTKIDVKVSMGSRKFFVEVPDFVGLKLDEAKIHLERLGLKLGEVKERQVENREIGEILEQSPRSGTEVEENSEINFVVNTELEEEKKEKEEKLNEATVEIKVPSGEEKQEVRVIVSDRVGIREVYRKIHSPNDKINLTVTGKGKMTIQVYINGELIKEETI